MEVVNYALSVELKAKQQDTLIKMQKSLILDKDRLILSNYEQSKLYRKKKNRQRVQYAVVGVLFGLVFGLYL